MKSLIFLTMLCALLSACDTFKAGDISKERLKLYEYNNNQEYCDEHPDRCVNNIPWS